HDVFAHSYEYASSLSYLGHRDGLKGDLSALDNLSFAAALGATGATNRAAVGEALMAVGVGEVAELPLRQLSAGQRRRVAICRSLLGDATLWILDEPFSNLDSPGRRWGHEQVSAHLDRGGAAVITSHHALALPGHAPRELSLGGG
ncbi:MAG: ATP-binding cassette domain-containing protein, partial [Pseudomonadota bacterium]